MLLLYNKCYAIVFCYHRRVRRGNALGCVCLSVCVCLFGLWVDLDLEIHLWYAGTPLEYLGMVHISRSSGQGQWHSNEKLYKDNKMHPFPCSPPSIERQHGFLLNLNFQLFGAGSDVTMTMRWSSLVVSYWLWLAYCAPPIHWSRCVTCGRTNAHNVTMRDRCRSHNLSNLFDWVFLADTALHGRSLLARWRSDKLSAGAPRRDGWPHEPRVDRGGIAPNPSIDHRSSVPADADQASVGHVSPETEVVFADSKRDRLWSRKRDDDTTINRRHERDRNNNFFFKSALNITCVSRHSSRGLYTEITLI